jgi:hypothetical protein
MWRQKCGFVLSPTPAHPGHSVMVWRVYGEVLVCTDVGQVGSAYQSGSSKRENHPLFGFHLTHCKGENLHPSNTPVEARAS